MEQQILATDGFSLAAKFYTAEETKAVVQVVHGMAEHKMRYDDFAQKLVSAGFSVVISDLRGHGKSVNSKKDLGYFADKNGHRLLIQDQYTINQIIRKKFPNRPVYMFAHSMGTLIARNYLQSHDDTIDKLVLSGAPCYMNGVRLAAAVSKILTYFTKTKGHHPLIHFFAATKTSRYEQKPNDWISYNYENVSAYNRDPLCGFPFTNAGYISLYELVYGLHQYKKYQCKNPQLDILFLSGMDDPVTGGDLGLSDSVSTLKKVGYQKINSKVYTHMKHEILHENQKEEVIADILRFYLRK